MYRLASLPVCPKWTNLSKATATEIFGYARLEESQAVRLKKVQQMVDHVGENTGRAIDVGFMAFVTMINFILSNTLMSVDLADYGSGSSILKAYLSSAEENEIGQAGAGFVGSGLSADAGVVGSGFGAAGSGLNKAGKFMGRTITGGQSSNKNGTPGTSTRITNPVENSGGAKPI